MLILLGTITIVIGFCMIASGIYKGAKKEEPDQEKKEYKNETAE